MMIYIPLGIASVDDAPIEKKVRIQHSKDEEKQFAQAFRVPYDDPKGKRVDRFVSFCNKCVKMWNPAKYYALYSSIVQSSGTGKSRLLAEVAKKRYVIYCCLRGPGSTGYPPSSPIRRKLITDAQATDPRKWPSERLYVSFLVAAIEVFQKTMSNNRMDCGTWFNYHTNESCSYWKEVEERMDCLGYEKRADFSEIHQKDAIAKALKNVGCFDKRFVTHLVFAFDEARSLLPSRSNADYFSSLRRALRCLPTYHPSQHQAFAIMLDTTSAVADFLPEMERDPSSRPLIEGLKLMPPFYLLDTIDDTITVATPPRSIEEMYCGQRLLQLGRPLFRSYIQAGDLSFFSTHLITLKNTAAAKLAGGEFPRVVQMTDALSVLSCRVCVDIVPTNHIASQLVASYMRFCVFVSESRQYLFTIAPSEPFLVDVATDLMYQNGCLVKLIKQLSDAMRCGVVDGGSRGELVARLLLILAVDQAIKQSLWKQELSHTCPVTVELFFDHLFGADALSKPVCSSTDQRELFKRGLIFFTHFIPVYYKPRRQHLLHALTRGAAIICERNNQGVDIIIPVLLPADVDTNYTDLHADDFTCEEDFPLNFTPEFPEDNEETNLITAYDNHGDRSKKRRLDSVSIVRCFASSFQLRFLIPAI